MPAILSHKEWLWKEESLWHKVRWWHQVVTRQERGRGELLPPLIVLRLCQLLGCPLWAGVKAWAWTGSGNFGWAAIPVSACWEEDGLSDSSTPPFQSNKFTIGDPISEVPADQTHHLSLLASLNYPQSNRGSNYVKLFVRFFKNILQPSAVLRKQDIYKSLGCLW